MSVVFSNKYPHLKFSTQWGITDKARYLLGQCEAYVQAISNTPILPQYWMNLLQISLIKGAQATTAIEGNTLTEREIEKVMEGSKLPPSKEYQEIEVKNILDAYNTLFNEDIKNHDGSKVITPDLIKRFHKMVGQNLGTHFDARPGEYRQDARTVGRYSCPDHQDVEVLVKELCEWLLRQFHYDKGQNFLELVIQAIVTHIYIEWIHPFGDGNGRTGRLLEFYILIRSGTPNIASHILSNHYNLTRNDYYRQIEIATKKRDLTEFIEYAVLGFRDGLLQTLEMIQQNHLQIIWKTYIYDYFDENEQWHEAVSKRIRTLILAMHLDKKYKLNEVSEISPAVAKEYAVLSPRTIERDIEKLLSTTLLLKEEEYYRVNIEQIHSRFYPRQKVR